MPESARTEDRIARGLIPSRDGARVAVGHFVTVHKSRSRWGVPQDAEYPACVIEVCVAGVTGWAGVAPAEAVDGADDLRLGGVARRCAGKTVAS